MSSFKKNKKASKYADCKNSGKESLLKYYGVKTERRAKHQNRDCKIISSRLQDISGLMGGIRLSCQHFLDIRNLKIRTNPFDLER